MARFISLKNAKREYLDTLTNEVVSKRQRDKALRSVFSEKPISNEQAARMARETNLDVALSRPARGRKSILKVEGVERETILEARKEDLARRKKIEEEQKEANIIARKVAKQELKQVKRTKITKKMLRPNSYGARANFNTYEDYLIMREEAKKTGVIHSYGLGMVGFDEKSGDSRGITVFPLRSINNRPVTKDLFDERFFEERMERQYFYFQHYFMHLAFDKDFAEENTRQWKAAGKPALKKRSTKRRSKRK